MNILTIHPYLLGTTWVFDDPRTGLKEEAFVMGMSEMISRLVEIKGIPNAAKGIGLSFSNKPFEGADAELTWLKSGDSEVLPGKDGSASQFFGNWYKGNVGGEEMEGWLCPALGLYFKAAPERIFVRAEQLPAGVDPIWHIGKNDPVAVRFVSAPATEGSAGSALNPQRGNETVGASDPIIRESRLTGRKPNCCHRFERAECGQGRHSLHDC